MVGALVRFAGQCDIKHNEFYLPELGVVIETPEMCVLWCRTELVVHGTMAPSENSTRYASARMLKNQVVKEMRKLENKRLEKMQELAAARGGRSGRHHPITRRGRAAARNRDA